MIVTIDISMYPNREDFIPPIKGFIKKINNYEDLKVVTYPTSTVVQGEYIYAIKMQQWLVQMPHLVLLQIDSQVLLPNI